VMTYGIPFPFKHHSQESNRYASKRPTSCKTASELLPNFVQAGEILHHCRKL